MCACVRILIVSVLALLDNLAPRLVSLAFYCKFFIQSREKKGKMSLGMRLVIRVWSAEIEYYCGGKS